MWFLHPSPLEHTCKNVRWFYECVFIFAAYMVNFLQQSEVITLCQPNRLGLHCLISVEHFLKSL